MVPRGGDGGRPVVGEVDGEAFALKVAGDHCGQRLLVVDDEHP